MIFFPVFNALIAAADAEPVLVGDWNQSQYLEVSTYSQEFRFTSPEDGSSPLDRRRLLACRRIASSARATWSTRAPA